MNFLWYHERHLLVVVQLVQQDRRLRPHSQHKLCRGTSDQVSSQIPKGKKCLSSKKHAPVRWTVRQLRGEGTHPVGKVRAQSCVAAQPLVGSIITFLHNVAGDHAAAIAQGRVPGQGDSRLDLVAGVEV